MPPPLIGGALSDGAAWRLTSVWRLSRTSGLSWEERGLGKTKIGTGSPRHTWLEHCREHHFQGQKQNVTRSLYSPRRYKASGSCSGERRNVLAVGTYCYVAVGSAARGVSAPTEGGEGREHIVASPAQLVRAHLSLSNNILAMLLRILSTLK